MRLLRSIQATALIGVCGGVILSGDATLPARGEAILRPLLAQAPARAAAKPPRNPCRPQGRRRQVRDCPTLAAANLVYTGAFRLPPPTGDCVVVGASGDGAPVCTYDPKSFDYGGRALAFNPSRPSLFLAGHDQYQWVAELGIPDIRMAASVDGLATAEPIQPLTQIFGDAFLSVIGTLPDDSGDVAALGGLLSWGSALVGTAYITYDGNGSQTHSHFRRSVDFADPAILGPSQLGDGRAGFVAGYMTPIPPEWQESFGGPALTGQCCISIISRSSLGPAASVFDPAAVGAPNIASTEVVGYPIGYPTLGWCEQNVAPLFNCATLMGGMVFPQNSRSVLFFGRQGTGALCYGDGTSDPDPPHGLCYDPTDASKGYHAYPYVHQVWAYDALDLLKVRNGELAPWDVRPYATWSFDLPFQSGSRVIRSVAYDPATSRIFLVSVFNDDARPLVHVFQVVR